MRKITIAAAAVSALALTSFGVEQMAHHKDYGSLCHVAAADSCAADKALADLVCDGRTDAAAINAVVALGVGHHAAELKKLGRALGVETVVVTEE